MTHDPPSNELVISTGGHDLSAGSCEPLISEAMPCFARAVLTVDEQFFEGVDMAGESDRHVCRIISGS